MCIYILVEVRDERRAAASAVRRQRRRPSNAENLLGIQIAFNVRARFELGRCVRALIIRCSIDGDYVEGVGSVCRLGTEKRKELISVGALVGLIKVVCQGDAILLRDLRFVIDGAIKCTDAFRSCESLVADGSDIG